MSHHHDGADGAFSVDEEISTERLFKVDLRPA